MFQEVMTLPDNITHGELIQMTNLYRSNPAKFQKRYEEAIKKRQEEQEAAANELRAQPSLNLSALDVNGVKNEYTRDVLAKFKVSDILGEGGDDDDADQEVPELIPPTPPPVLGPITGSDVDAVITAMTEAVVNNDDIV